MRLLIPAVLLAALSCTAQERPAAPPPSEGSGRPQESNKPEKSKTTVPAGTKIVLALTSPVWAETANPGDRVYATTAFPVAFNNEMAIPAGTYVGGTIDAIKRPTWRSSHAEFQMHFTRFIFANGYTIELPAGSVVVPGPAIQNVTDTEPAVLQTSVAVGSAAASPVAGAAATASVYVEVSSSNDILLDNGTQIEMVLQLPLSLDAKSVADAVRRSKPFQVTPFRSSTRCVPTSGTPGTSDTVIPGTSGTSPTVIPGGPGMPDTVIPGTPGTEPTIIHGTPGTSGTTCPGPPFVTVKPEFEIVHTESFRLTDPVRLAKKQLPAGTYQVTWKGLGPIAQVDILQNGKQVVRAKARVATLDKKSPANDLVKRSNADGSTSLASLEFAGETFALFFD